MDDNVSLVRGNERTGWERERGTLHTWIEDKKADLFFIVPLYGLEQRKPINVKFTVSHHLGIFIKVGEIERAGDGLGGGESKDAKKERQESVEGEEEEDEHGCQWTVN